MPRGTLLQSRDGGGMSHGGSPRWEEPFWRETTPLYISVLQSQHQRSTPFQNEGCSCPGCWVRFALNIFIWPTKEGDEVIPKFHDYLWWWNGLPLENLQAAVLPYLLLDRSIAFNMSFFIVITRLECMRVVFLKLVLIICWVLHWCQILENEIVELVLRRDKERQWTNYFVIIST